MQKSSNACRICLLRRIDPIMLQVHAMRPVTRCIEHCVSLTAPDGLIASSTGRIEIALPKVTAKQVSACAPPSGSCTIQLRTRKWYAWAVQDCKVRHRCCYECVSVEQVQLCSVTCHMQKIPADGHTDQILTLPCSSDDNSTSALPDIPAAKASWKMSCTAVCSQQLTCCRNLHVCSVPRHAAAAQSLQPLTSDILGAHHLTSHNSP